MGSPARSDSAIELVSEYGEAGDEVGVVVLLLVRSNALASPAPISPNDVDDDGVFWNRKDCAVALEDVLCPFGRLSLDLLADILLVAFGNARFFFVFSILRLSTECHYFTHIQTSFMWLFFEKLS